MEAKSVIGRLAAALAMDGDQIFLDSGTTCFQMLPYLRRRRGLSIVTNSTRLATELEGIALCPETAICIGVLERGLKEGHIDPAERIVIFNTGAMQKYLEVMETEIPRLDRHNLDWDAL